MIMIANRKYSNGIAEYIKTAKKTLTERYGYYEPSWDLMFEMLADNMMLYEQCWKSVQEKGVYNDEKQLKHPLISSLKDLQATILKIIQQNGLSVWSESKIKQTDEDDSDDFIERLKAQ